MLQPVIRHKIQLYSADIVVDAVGDAETVYALKTLANFNKSEADLLARACRWGRILLQLTTKTLVGSPVFTIDGIRYGWASGTLQKPSHPTQQTITPTTAGLWLLEIHQVFPHDITHIALDATVTTLGAGDKISFDYENTYLYLEV
jgi:hypothetical protein